MLDKLVIPEPEAARCAPRDGSLERNAISDDIFGSQSSVREVASAERTSLPKPLLKNNQLIDGETQTGETMHCIVGLINLYC